MTSRFACMSWPDATVCAEQATSSAARGRLASFQGSRIIPRQHADSWLSKRFRRSDAETERMTRSCRRKRAPMRELSRCVGLPNTGGGWCL